MLDETGLTEPNALSKAWARIPKDYHGDIGLILHYIDLARRYGQDMASLEQLLIKAINHQWDAHAVDYYGRMVDNDVLLLALGRICIRLRLWGKAQSYLEASVGVKPGAENCLELADLLTREELGQADQAGQYYQQGLNLCLKAQS